MFFKNSYPLPPLPYHSIIMIHSISVLSLSTHNLIVYNRTRNATLNDGSHVWPSDTRIWPTKVMIAVGAISLFLASGVLISYAWGIKYANRMATIKTIIGIGISLFKIVMFAIAGSLFLGASRPPPAGGGGQESLWSVSCNANDTSKSLFSRIENFAQVCAMQVRRLSSVVNRSTGN